MAGADADYRTVATAKFQQMSDFRDKAFETQADYGKWLISSLFLMHGSAIAGLLFKSGAATAPPYLLEVLWFVGGLVFALGAGAAAWWNFTFAMMYYHAWAQPEMLIDKDYRPDLPSKTAIDLTMWLALVCASMSVACLVFGAAHVASVWH